MSEVRRGTQPTAQAQQQQGGGESGGGAPVATRAAPPSLSLPSPSLDITCSGTAGCGKLVRARGQVPQRES